MNISLHDPELYYFLTLLAGIAALLAVIYEFPRRKPGRWKRAAALLRDRSLPTGEKHVGEKIDESPRPAGEQEGLASFPSEPITVGGTIRARLFHVLIEGEAKRKHLGRGPRICESVDVPPKEQASRGINISESLDERRPRRAEASDHERRNYRPASEHRVYAKSG